MARKSTRNANNTDTSSQSNAAGSVLPTTNATNRRLLKYVAIAVIVGVVLVLGYYTITGVSSHSLNSKQIFSNVSSYDLNQTQSLFVNDLEKSENVSSLQVAYYSSNTTEQVPESGNVTIAITYNQTIDSYKSDTYNKTVITDTVAYTNSETGARIIKNVSSVYYYDTNTTVTCLNDTSYSALSVTNSSLQCGFGDQGWSYLEETPFTAANVSALSYLVFNNTITYKGVKSIAGRSCDGFIFSNATAANLQSNYTIYNLCIDTRYGIPLYFNATEVAGGVPNSFVFTATAVTTSVSASEFVIPPQYLSAIPNSII